MFTEMEAWRLHLALLRWCG